MKKQEIINNIVSVVNVLNTIDVHGKQALLNLGGCIAVLEECAQKMSTLPITLPAAEEAKVERGE